VTEKNYGLEEEIQGPHGEISKQRRLWVGERQWALMGLGTAEILKWAHLQFSRI